MFIVNEFQIVALDSDVFLTSTSIGAKIPNPKLAQILSLLKHYPHSECSETQLEQLADQFSVPLNALKKVLIEQLNVLKPMISKKIPCIYINSDDTWIESILTQTLEKQYTVKTKTQLSTEYEENALLLLYRSNYSHQDFKTLYQNLGNNLYLITAGVLHQLLIIDNLYMQGSGLPTHFSNLHQMIAYLNSDIPATKNNWLLFYREFVKKSVDRFPDPEINTCQRAYIAYCLYQFISQYTDLWGTPTPLDQVNCFWQADLTNFSVQSEAAIHSPFSEFDMKINTQELLENEVIEL